MANGVAARPHWIDEVCRRFSHSVGWPIVFRDRQDLPGDDPSPEECGGALCVDLPPGYEADPHWENVRQLAHLLSQFINRTLELESGETAETRFARRMLHLAREIARPVLPGEAIPRLLRLVVDVASADGAAFFLLNPDDPELLLRARWSAVEMPPIPSRRTLSGHAPDLQAMVKGPLQVRRSDGNANAHWLPNAWRMGVCLPLRTGSQPIGTMWSFYCRERTVSQIELDLLKTIAGLLSNDLERTVLCEESRDRKRIRKEIQAASREREDATQRPFAAALRQSTRDKIGGDLCEIVPLDDRRTALVVGDAAGDGIPAAMIRARVEGALFNLLRGMTDFTATDSVVVKLNETLRQLLADDQFCSLFLGIYDSETRQLACTNAGHPSPLHVSGGEVAEVKSHGMLLGVMASSGYGRSTIEIREGDLLVVCTDGVADALTKETGTGLARLLQNRLAREPHLSADGIADIVWNRVTACTELEDDRSLMVVRFSDPAETTTADRRPAPRLLRR